MVWHFLVALAPIVVVLVLLATRVPSLWAGVAGLGTALLGTAVAFRPTGDVVQATVADMGPTVLEVALLLLGGVGLATAMARTGAQDRIASWLRETESGADRTVTLLLLVFGMTPFMESVTGFGLGVVITAPLLVQLGLPPAKAVLASLLGMVLVPWGSLGPGTLIAAQLGGEDLHALGVESALLTPVVLIVSMVAVLGVLVGRPDARQLALAAGVIVVEWGVLLGANVLIGTPLSGVLAPAAVMAGLLMVTRLTHGPLPRISAPLVRSVVPHLVLVAGILASTALLAVTDTADWLDWLSSPALWLIVAAVVAITASGVPVDRAAVARGALRRWVPTAANALVFMVLGIVMAATGMAEHLATTAAHLGFGFVATIPAIGALGGYLTGSNTGAAAMFSSATSAAAANLGADPLVALAGQNVAGSFAIIASPPRIALATAVTLAAGERLPGSAMRVIVRSVLVAAVVLGGAMLLLA
ncbi:L-lactate permease [Nakamurella leprariae]|uniref:L-lactate permease n=1 Tax=Nakamurella leprariae TaxID=2803911 RepID=A0A938YJ46_9ACTN|nr:L-lactate permease [Nakamurella leprariae]MBM9468740.1 L-lactate permease [Nakamurella leprariae]